MTSPLDLEKSAAGVFAGVSLALALLFTFIFDSWRVGIITGIFAGIILALCVMWLDVSHRDVQKTKH